MQLTEEQKMLRETVQDFAQTRIKPIAQEIGEGTSEIQRLEIASTLLQERTHECSNWDDFGWI